MICNTVIDVLCMEVGDAYWASHACRLDAREKGLVPAVLTCDMATPSSSAPSNDVWSMRCDTT